jgi:hypothetical protein
VPALTTLGMLLPATEVQAAPASCWHRPPAPLDFRFCADSGGGTAGFSDLPAHELEGDFYGLSFRRARIPRLQSSDRLLGLRLSGDNHSDDLFKYVKRQITGLRPHAEYVVRLRLTLFSNAGRDCVGTLPLLIRPSPAPLRAFRLEHPPCRERDGESAAAALGHADRHCCRRPATGGAEHAPGQLRRGLRCGLACRADRSQVPFSQSPDAVTSELPGWTSKQTDLLLGVLADDAFTGCSWKMETPRGRRMARETLGEEKARQLEQFYKLALASHGNFLSKATINLSLQVRAAWRRLHGFESRFVQETVQLRRRKTAR